jgi:hypothetical protein
MTLINSHRGQKVVFDASNSKKYLYEILPLNKEAIFKESEKKTTCMAGEQQQDHLKFILIHIYTCAHPCTFE